MMTTAPTRKQRLTLAVLESPASVLEAVDALTRGGLPPCQIGLAASSGWLDRLELLCRLMRPRHGWAERVLRRLTLAAPGVEATPGPLLSCLEQHQAGTKPLQPRDGWISGDLEAALLEHIARGRVALGVSACDANQQWTSVRILLGEADLKVLTFEFVPASQE